MSKPRPSRPAAHRPAGPAPRQPAYSQHARSYEQRTGAFQRHRDTLVEALPVSQGQVVLDVGCGTGLCYGLLQEKVGPQGRVVGIEESPEMATVARERIAAEGWANVTVVQSPAEDAKIPVTADAALFCAVHDILQSPGALQNIMSNLRPGAWVAAGGGKWAPWAMMALNRTPGQRLTSSSTSALPDTARPAAPHRITGPEASVDQCSVSHPYRSIRFGGSGSTACPIRTPLPGIVLPVS